jgi:hypothetical protein
MVLGRDSGIIVVLALSVLAAGAEADVYRGVQDCGTPSKESEEEGSTDFLEGIACDLDYFHHFGTHREIKN